MGRGSNHKPDVAMAEPVKLLEEVRKMQAAGAGESSGSGDVDEFCTREQDVPFQLAPGAAGVIGQSVQVVLQIGGHPAVICDGQSIGEVDGPHSKPLIACLRFSYRMAGEIASIDHARQQGSVLIAGTLARAA